MRPAVLRSSFALAALLVVAGSLPAIGDRENTTPTSSVWYHGQSASQINTLRSNGWRIVSLDVEATSPMRFTVAFVSNSGSYYRSGRAWYYGSPSFIAGKLSGRRITSLTPYVINNNVYLAASMVSNTGSQYRDWRYYYGTLSYISSKVSAFGGRILDLDTFVIGSKRYYTAVMVKNTGSEARSWWWYVGASASYINSKLQQNGARLFDLDRVGSTTFNCVMVKNTGAAAAKWWWYYGLTSGGVSNALAQNGARLIDIESYGSGSLQRFNVVMINNSNALTTRVGEILRTSSGASGAYLKQVGGSVRAWLRANRVFEPASSIKVLLHAHAMKQVQLGKIKLTDKLRVYLGTSGSCPQYTSPIYEPLSTVLQKMMENSDNNRTMAVADYFGLANVHATAAALGMKNTKILHRIGCGGPTPNRMTLEDSGSLHEKVAGGWLGSQKQTFYNLMLNGGYDTLVDQEAAKLSLPANKIRQFKSYIRRAHKGGSYDIGTRSGFRYYRSATGWFQLPFCIGNKVVIREYVLGVFVDGATNKTLANNANSKAWGELPRDEIRAALVTWKSAFVPGSIKTFGTGCPGSNGVVTQTASGKAEIGTTTTFFLKNGPKSSVAILNIGFSNTSWGPLRLPFDLTPFGATGCKLYTPPTVPLGFATSTLGTLGVALPHPNNKAFIGLRFFTQYTCIDPKGNRFGLTYSNGVETHLGGWKK